MDTVDSVMLLHHFQGLISLTTTMLDFILLHWVEQPNKLTMALYAFYCLYDFLWVQENYYILIYLKWYFNNIRIITKYWHLWQINTILHTWKNAFFKCPSSNTICHTSTRAWLTRFLTLLILKMIKFTWSTSWWPEVISRSTVHYKYRNTS